MAFSNIHPFPALMTPITNISPLTYRDAATFLDYLETIKQWLNETLVPDSNEMLNNAVAEFQLGIANAEATISQLAGVWDNRFKAVIQDLNSQIAVLNDVAIKTLVDNPTSVTGLAIRTLISSLTIPLAAKGTANGVATLGADSKVPFSQLPDTIPLAAKGTANGVATLGADSKVPFSQLPDTSGSGNLSVRPAPTAVRPGFVFYALDTKETYRSSGSAWVLVDRGVSEGVSNGVATLGANSKVPFVQLPEPSGSGNLSARPTAVSVVPGFTYYSLDTKESYRSTGSVWVVVGKGGRQGSASIVTVFETTSTALVDVPGLAVTFTAGSGIAKITFSCECSQTVAKGKIIFVLEINGEDSGHVPVSFPEAGNSTASRVFEKTSLIPGNIYTAKIKMLVGSTGGFGKIEAQTYNPATLIVESV